MEVLPVETPQTRAGSYYLSNLIQQPYFVHWPVWALKNQQCTLQSAVSNLLPTSLFLITFLCLLLVKACLPTNLYPYPDS